jgi:hypothetical protein
MTTWHKQQLEQVKHQGGGAVFVGWSPEPSPVWRRGFLPSSPARWRDSS